MSSGVNKMYEEYEYYCTLCKKYGEDAEPIHNTEAWTHHLESLTFYINN